MPDIEALHIVQSDAEQKKIEKAGQRVILNLATLGREALAADEITAPQWDEPQDMRDLTDFPWSPIYADRYLPTYSEPTRSRLAGAIQQALEDIFAQNRIDGVLTEPVALFPTHYMLYLCKRSGAVPLFWANTFHPGYLYFVSDVHLATPASLPAQDEGAMEILRQSADQFVKRVAEDKAGPIYHHQFAKTKRGIGGYMRQRSGHEALVLSPNLSTKAIQMARLARVAIHRALFPRLGDYMTAGAVSEHAFSMRNLIGGMGYYDRPAESFDAGNVFFPLQYEPEASLLYAAPAFRNQAAVVESILQSLPEKQVLWVKEHPNQFGALRHSQWRALRKRYPNLRLVFGRENGRHLIQRCGLSVSITSTAGLDAMIYGRRCIVLGDVFYRNFPGALPVRGLEAMSRALNDPANYCMTERPDFDTTPLVTSLAEFGRHCHPGDPQPSSDLYTDENVANLRAAIGLALETQQDYSATAAATSVADR